MGLFSRKKDSPPSSNNPKDDFSDSSSEISKVNTNDTKKKEGFYARYENKKRGEIREEDLQKYLGKSKAELMAWAENEPGVGKNRAAGTLAAGNTPGLGGMSAAEGMGGWGRSAGANDRSGGLKFPPKQPEAQAAAASERDPNDPKLSGNVKKGLEDMEKCSVV